MNRKDITEFLGKLLIRDKLADTYWAKEVTMDYSSSDVRRVDFMQFKPQHQRSLSGLEKGVFTCYEIKSCKADFKSGFGVNFVGEKNYLVMPMKTYKEVINDIPENIGVLCPISVNKDKFGEFENPTELNGDTSLWSLEAVRFPLEKERSKSIVELLFCMMRSGRY